MSCGKRPPNYVADPAAWKQFALNHGYALCESCHEPMSKDHKGKLCNTCRAVEADIDWRLRSDREYALMHRQEDE